MCVTVFWWASGGLWFSVVSSRWFVRFVGLVAVRWFALDAGAGCGGGDVGSGVGELVGAGVGELVGAGVGGLAGAGVGELVRVGDCDLVGAGDATSAKVAYRQYHRG